MRPHPDRPHAPWTAPTAAGPVTATVRLPGSKSMTARALVLSALADGPSQIDRPLRARDTTLMAAGLRAMGAGVDTADDERWLGQPGPAARSGPGRRGPGRHDHALRCRRSPRWPTARSPSTATRTHATARCARSSRRCARSAWRSTPRRPAACR